MREGISLLLFARLIMLILVIVVSIYLLHRNSVTKNIRLAFLFGGVLCFGFFFSWLIPEKMDLNPVLALRTFFGGIPKVLDVSSTVSGNRAAGLSGLVMVLLLLGISWLSNKSFCGWACQLGLLQDLLYRIRLPKWKPPFWLSNSIRIFAVTIVISALVTAGLDLIGFVDPFQLFRFNYTLGIGIFTFFLIVASLFVYRPWCQFLCPLGLVSWLAEQFSLMRPRINRVSCKRCLLCIKACPTQAMADIYAGKKIHADCFACGACLNSCPQKGALSWSTKKTSSIDSKEELSA